MDKKGFELASNFLVVIILSLVLFGAGIFIFGKIITTGENIKTDIDAKTIEELDRVMDNGDLVVLPRNRVSIERGKSEVIAAGFWNEGPTTANFAVTVIPKDSIAGTPVQASIISDYQNVNVNEKIHFLINIKVPQGAGKGQHYFDLSVRKTYTPPPPEPPNPVSVEYPAKRFYVLVP